MSSSPATAAMPALAATRFASSHSLEFPAETSGTHARLDGRPFLERLMNRQDLSRELLRQVARDYRANYAAVAPGPGWDARIFALSADLLRHGSELPRYEERQRALADALARVGTIVPVPGRTDAHLLCDLRGQPQQAFLPRPPGCTELRASMAVAFARRLRVDHGVSLDIGEPVPHVLPGLGRGLLVPAPDGLASPLQDAFAASHAGDIGAQAMRDLAAREAACAMSPQSLQRLVLGRMLTLDWQRSPFEQQQLVDDNGRCWPLTDGSIFLDDPALLLSLSAMQRHDRIAPLFLTPDGEDPAWDQPLDPALVAAVRCIDPGRLQDELMQDLRALARQHAAGGAATGEDSPAFVETRRAMLRSVDALRVVRTLIEEDPGLSLRMLSWRFPARLDWLDRPHAPALDRVTAVPQRGPTPESAKQLAPPLPELRPIEDDELTELRRRFSPFNPFKRRDKVLGPLLDRVKKLRKMKSGARRERAVADLRTAAAKALHRVGDPKSVGEGPHVEAWRHEAGDDERRQLLERLIADTDKRYGPSISAVNKPKKKPVLCSWFPWWRRA